MNISDRKKRLVLEKDKFPFRKYFNLLLGAI